MDVNSFADLVINLSYWTKVKCVLMLLLDEKLTSHNSSLSCGEYEYLYKLTSTFVRSFTG